MKICQECGKEWAHSSVGFCQACCDKHIARLKESKQEATKAPSVPAMFVRETNLTNIEIWR